MADDRISPSLPSGGGAESLRATRGGGESALPLAPTVTALRTAPPPPLRRGGEVELLASLGVGEEDLPASLMGFRDARRAAVFKERVHG